MKKGQASLDLIFAVLAVVIVVQATTVFVDDYTLNQNIASIRNQEKAILDDLYRTIATGYQTADPNNRLSVQYYIPEIHAAGYEELDCEITITRSLFSISVSGSQIGVEEDITYTIIPSIDLPEIDGIFQGGMEPNCGEEVFILIRGRDG